MSFRNRGGAMEDGLNGKLGWSEEQGRGNEVWKLESIIHMILAVICLQLLAGVVVQGPKLLNPEWDLTKEAPFFMLVLGQSVFQVGVLLSIHLFLLARCRLKWSEAFGLRWSRQDLFYGMVVGAVAIVSGHLFGALSHWVMELGGVESEPQAAVEAFSRYSSLGQQIYLTLSAVVLAPIVEELLFRGVLFQSLYRLGYVHWAYWGASALFAVAHGLPQALLSMLVLGVLFSWVFRRRWNLGAAIVAHAMFNGYNLVLIYLWK